MRCYCGQSQPGIWDQRGIVHNGSECRYTDLLITVSGTYRQAELEGEAFDIDGLTVQLSDGRHVASHYTAWGDGAV